MAACFDSYWCWASPYIAGRTLSAAYSLGIPAIYTESRGCGGVRNQDLAALHGGLLHYLQTFEFLPEQCPTLESPAQHFSDDAEEAHLQTNHPSPQDGIFMPEVLLGEVLTAGEKIGNIHALSGDSCLPVYANQSGTVVMLSRQRSVAKGHALASLVAIDA